jgi:enoyl-CoA hydratase/carnithine racemase
VTEGDLVTAAQDYVRQLAASVSPASMADTKALVYGHLGEHYATALREIDEYVWRAIARPDSKEGVASFLERRPPEFPRLGG